MCPGKSPRGAGIEEAAFALVGYTVITVDGPRHHVLGRLLANPIVWCDLGYDYSSFSQPTLPVS